MDLTRIDWITTIQTISVVRRTDEITLQSGSDTVPMPMPVRCFRHAIDSPLADLRELISMLGAVNLDRSTLDEGDAVSAYRKIGLSAVTGGVRTPRACACMLCVHLSSHAASMTAAPWGWSSPLAT